MIESLVFQPDGPIVVVCVRCHNTFPIIVLFITTRGFKHDQTTKREAVDRPPSEPFEIADNLSPEVKAREDSSDAIDQEGDEGKKLQNWHLK